MMESAFSWIVTFVIAIITFFTVKKYLKIRSLPPGPFPLPLVGNLLSFRGKTAVDVFNEYRKQYGSIFTIWMGTVPFVALADAPQIKEALIDRRNDFAGRATLTSTQIFLDGATNIADSDYSPATETLRKMGLAAVRKYTVSERLPPLIESITQETVDDMLKEKEPFDPKNHLYHLLSTYVASSIFGKRFEKNDPEFLAFRDVAESLTLEFGTGFMADFLPFLRIFYRKSEENLRKTTKIAIPMVRKKMQEHMDTYEPGLERDMMDSLLSAREETIAEGKQSAVYMSDRNMLYAIYDLYFASIETSSATTRWIFLLLATYPEIQEKVIAELRDVIGDRLAVQEDRKLCPFTTAVIYETLRFRGTAPFLLPRKAIRDSVVDGYKIPEGTNVLVCADMVHKNPTYWPDPQVFNPERFLQPDKSFSESKMNEHMPFGKGRRSCIGEKLAITQIFLILATVFRKCRIVMKQPPKDTNPDENISVFFMAKEFKIIAEPLS